MEPKGQTELQESSNSRGFPYGVREMSAVFTKTCGVGRADVIRAAPRSGRSRAGTRTRSASRCAESKATHSPWVSVPSLPLQNPLGSSFPSRTIPNKVPSILSPFFLPFLFEQVTEQCARGSECPPNTNKQPLFHSLMVRLIIASPGAGAATGTCHRPLTKQD